MQSMRAKRLAAAFFEGLWIYSLILWAWIAVNYYIYPEFQTGPLTLYLPVPQNLVATIAFPVSFVSFVIWRYLGRQT